MVTSGFFEFMEAGLGPDWREHGRFGKWMDDNYDGEHQHTLDFLESAYTDYAAGKMTTEDLVRAVELVKKTFTPLIAQYAAHRGWTVEIKLEYRLRARESFGKLRSSNRPETPVANNEGTNELRLLRGERKPTDE